jgi:RimJ/RimL family protein N-acetyltransferase
MADLEKAIQIRRFRGETEIALDIERLVTESDARNEWVPSLLKRGNKEISAAEYVRMVFYPSVCFYAFDTDAKKVAGVAGYREKSKESFVERGIIDNRDEPCFSSMLIDMDYRRLGLGMLLINARCEHAQQKGHQTIIARTWTTNEASIRLHLKAGFEVFYTDHDCPDRPEGIGSIYFRRQLV